MESRRAGSNVSRSHAHDMNRVRKPLVFLLAVLMVAPGGCSSFNGGKFHGAPNDDYDQMSLEIEYPAESAATVCDTDESLAAPPPWTLTSEEPPEYQDISLEEVIRIALCNSRRAARFGRRDRPAPATQRTAWDTAITETDPQFGVDAALSAFDAQFTTSVFGEKNDRALNNEFFGGGTRLLNQDASFPSRRSPNGRPPAPSSPSGTTPTTTPTTPRATLFPSAWNTNVEVEARQPLLQGSGVEFNRIAGPSTTPGVYNGVLVAPHRTPTSRSPTSRLPSATW